MVVVVAQNQKSKTKNIYLIKSHSVCDNSNAYITYRERESLRDLERERERDSRLELERERERESRFGERERERE